jgi:vacuolar-type H+-ATPase subunit I/STV1
VEDSPLSEYKKDLLIRIDVLGQTVVQVAKELGKAKSTISSQHTKAFEEFEAWRKGSAEQAGSKDFDALVFQKLNSGGLPNEIIAEYGQAAGVKSLYQVWKEMETDDLSEATRWLRDYGAIDNSAENVARRKLLSDGVGRLIDMVNQAEWAKEEAEKKLTENENTVGTIELLEQRKQELENGIEELARINDGLKQECEDLQTKKAQQIGEIEEAKDKFDELRKKTMQLDESSKEEKIRCEMLHAQLKDLQENLRHYRTKHGMNIKVGDLICKKGRPDLLYIVVGESEDKNSWMARVFDSSRLAEVVQKEGIPSIRDLEGPLPKKDAIENWEVVDLSENLQDWKGS